MVQLLSYLFLWFHTVAFPQLIFPNYIVEAGNWPRIANTKGKFMIGSSTRKFTFISYWNFPKVNATKKL